MAATVPSIRSQLVRSLGAPVKSWDRREPREADACMPKTMSTTPTTSREFRNTGLQRAFTGVDSGGTQGCWRSVGLV
jgi:hypothetical protein